MIGILKFPSDLALASSAFILLSTSSYLIMVTLLGYTYELFFFCNFVFVIIGLSMLALEGFGGHVFFRLLYFVVILALFEELLLNSALAWYGLMLAFLSLIMLPVAGVILAKRGEDVRVVLEVSGLIFATRIVFSPFPIQLLQSAAILPAIYTLIMSGIVFYIWFRKIPFAKIGFSQGAIRFPLQILAGLIVGLLLGFIEYPILKPQPVDLGSNILSNLLYIFIIMMVFVGLTEELLYRGLLQSYMVGLMPRWQAVHLTSLIFALFHIGWLNPLEVVFAYSAGIVFGCLMIKTNSLASSVMAHGFGNVMLYSLAQAL